MGWGKRSTGIGFYEDQNVHYPMRRRERRIYGKVYIERIEGRLGGVGDIEG